MDGDPTALDMPSVKRHTQHCLAAYRAAIAERHRCLRQQDSGSKRRVLDMLEAKTPHQQLPHCLLAARLQGIGLLARLPL